MKLLFTFLTAILCANIALADLSFTTNNAIYPTTSTTWDFKETQLQQVKTAQSLPLQHLQLQITDGKDNKQLALSTPKITTGKSTFTATQTSNNIQFTQQIRVFPTQQNAVQWQIEIANNGTQEIWLEAGLAGNVSGANLQFWDGYSLQKVGTKTLQRSTPEMAFPATMIRNTMQKDAIVVAMNPDNDISWMTTSLDPAQQKYFYGGRFVIPAGQKVHFGYTLFTLAPQFDELDVVDGYYARYPSYFTAQPNTDPRLTDFRGVNSSYIPRNVTAISDDPKTSIVEGLGKLYASWDWGYDPYKFSGDWFGRAEDWNLQLSRGDQLSLEGSLDKDGRYRGLNLRDINQFHRDRIALFKRSDVRSNIPQAFYIVNFAQAELLKKNGWMKYTYGYRRWDDQTSGRIKHWVAPYDDTWHVFPWATPFGDTFKRDLPEILKELDTSSFAIDLFADNAPYRGETTAYIPGWSYDDKGKFIDTAIAHKHLVEYIHSLKKDNSTASLVANLSPFADDPALKLDDKQKAITNYATAFTPDSYIMEGNVSQMVDYDRPDRLFPKRYLFGKKYISSVSGAYNDSFGERIPWRTMSPNQIRAAVKKYYQKRVMAYYQGGLLPNYDDQRGIEFIANETPRLLEIQSRGFAAAPASEGNKELQRRRYGDAIGAAIVYSNPTANDISSDEILQNEYFGDDNVIVPFDIDGKSVNFSQAQNQQTSFALNVESMENRIMLFPIALQGANIGKLQGTSKATLNANQQEYEINLTVDHAQKVLLQIVPPRDFALQSVSVNSKQVPNNTLAAELATGENHIKVLFTSTQFHATEQQYRDFSWKNYQIVITGNQNDKTDSAAQIITDYSDHYLKFKPAIIRKSTFDAASATTPTIIISTNPQKRGVYFDTNPKVLFISGADDFDTQQLAWRLMRLMDRTQPVLPSASFTNLSTKAMMDAIGLMHNAQTSSVAKQISAQSLAPVAGEDKPLSGSGGDIGSLDFEKILPLPRDGWKVSASAIYTNDKTVSLEAALDAKPGTRWTGGKGKKGAWFMVDMQKSQTFNHVELKSSFPWKYSPRHYKAEVSDDGNTWRNPVEGGGAEDGVQDTNIFWPQMQTARYVRISLTEDQTQFWSIDEIYVYKRALAQNSSTASPLKELSHLAIPLVQVLGDIEKEAGQNFSLDLDKTTEFSSVQLVIPSDYKIYPIRYKAELSDDDTNWRSAVTGNVDKGDVSIRWPQMQKARYIRITRLQSQEKWAIDEIKIHLKPTDNSTVAFSDKSIVVDGKLDEAAWQKAAKIELDVPLKNHPITQKTEVAIFHDSKALYLGFTLHEANMNKLWETAKERDGAVWEGDDVEIYIAPGANEGKIKYPYYQFLFSPSGIQTDLKFNAEGKGDIKWNGDWQVKTRKLADRWIAEVRIPLTDIDGVGKSTFRANIGRIETPNGDVTTWAPMKRIFAQPDLFGVWELAEN